MIILFCVSSIICVFLTSYVSGITCIWVSVTATDVSPHFIAVTLSCTSDSGTYSKSSSESSESLSFASATILSGSS